MTLTAGVLPLERRYRPSGPLDLDATLGPHRRGRFDPCHRVGPDGAHWRTWRTPNGAATVRLAADPAAGEISTQAWGSGADWALAAVPSLLGVDDDWTGLELPPGRVRDTRRRLPGMRLSSSGRVFEALVPAILEQLVTGIEARRTWTAIGAPVRRTRNWSGARGHGGGTVARGDPLDHRLGVAPHRPRRRAPTHPAHVPRRWPRDSRRSARSPPKPRCSGS